VALYFDMISNKNEIADD